MGRKKKPIEYSIIEADTVCCISDEMVYLPDSEPETSLADKLQCPAADEVMIALRKSFSLTYPRNPFIDGLEASLSDIRRICVEALKPIPEVLVDLQLAALPTIMNDPSTGKVHLLKFMFARTKEVDIRVNIDGKKQKLLDSFWHHDANALISACRAIISTTFSEAFDEDQHMALLMQIRTKIHSVLPPLNDCLTAIEIEPIADKVSLDVNEE